MISSLRFLISPRLLLISVSAAFLLAACDDAGNQKAAENVPISGKTSPPAENGRSGPESPPAAANGDGAHRRPAARNAAPRAPETASRPAPSVTQSAYDFMDQGLMERPGYGLYTYALFPNAFLVERNAEFLRALFRTTPGAPSVPLAPRLLNIIYVPVTGGDQAWGLLRAPNMSPAEKATALAGQIYDHDLAGRMLGFFCDNHPEACAQGIGNGPYLLTVARPLSGSAGPAAAYLLIDLGRIHPGAFARFVEAMKAQVTRPDFTDRAKVDTVANDLLQIVLTAADWLDPIREGMAAILKVGG